MDNPLQRFKGLLSYIEANLRGTITLEMLARESGFSCFQIIRMFKKICGYSPSDYIRRRKILMSNADLFANREIADIARAYGFENERSYLRAFRSVYGVSPTKLINSKGEIVLFEPWKIVNMKEYSNSLVTEPLIKYFPGGTYTGEEKYYNSKDNHAEAKLLADEVSQAKRGIFTGIRMPCGSGTFSHRYISCWEDNPNHNTTHLLPDGKYGIFNYIGFHSLDEVGAHQLRRLMYVVIDSWAKKKNIRWKESFIEQVDISSLNYDYCEVRIMVPC